MWYPTTPSGKVGLALPVKCPYGLADDTLWVKETFTHVPRAHKKQDLLYAADYLNPSVIAKWSPGQRMRQEYSRLQVKLSSVRVTLTDDGGSWVWRMCLERLEKPE